MGRWAWQDGGAGEAQRCRGQSEGEAGGACPCTRARPLGPRPPPPPRVIEELLVGTAAGGNGTGAWGPRRRGMHGPAVAHGNGGRDARPPGRSRLHPRQVARRGKRGAPHRGGGGEPAPFSGGPKRGENAMSPLHSRGFPTKGTKSDLKTYARGNNDAPSISKYGSLVRADAQIGAKR